VIYLDEFVKTQIVEKYISKNTRANYRGDFKLFLNYLMKQVIKATIDELNKHLLRQFFQYLKFEKGYATATMRRKIHFLSSFCKFLYFTILLLNLHSLQPNYTQHLSLFKL